MKYIKKGYEVRFLSLCNGSGGHHIMTSEETVKKRAQESAQVAKILGITYDVWSDVDDCTLVADLETRRRMIRYIRNFNPDLIITHRPYDYHADHRAAGQLVQDASYLLIVPHECPDAPAMQKMPVIMYNEDEGEYTYPPFRADYIFDIDNEIDKKFEILDANDSQVYEWLPYTDGEVAPLDKKERFLWMKGMEITKETTDEEVLAATRGYAPRFAKVAAKYRKELIKRYGREHGEKVRFAEVFEVCEYGAKITPEIEKALFNF